MKKRLESDLAGNFLDHVRVYDADEVDSYIKANLDTGKTEPMSVEEIRQFVDKGWEDVVGTNLLESFSASIAEAVAPLTVRQGFVVDWKSQLLPMVPWDKVCSTRVVVMGYDMAGQQVCQFGYIDRPAPKMRKRTREEKIHELHERHVFGGARIGDIFEYTIDDLCQAAGIDLEVQE